MPGSLEGDAVRIAVHGTSRSGMTSAARALAEAIEAPLLELDAVRHQPGWKVLPDEDLRPLVADAAAGERWVIDGNYEVVRALVTVGRRTSCGSTCRGG